MDRDRKQKVLGRLRSKYNSLDKEIHKKVMEVDRISHKKARGLFNSNQLDSMHKQIMRGYDLIKKKTTQRDKVDKKIHHVRHL